MKGTNAFGKLGRTLCRRFCPFGAGSKGEERTRGKPALSPTYREWSRVGKEVVYSETLDNNRLGICWILVQEKGEA
jgi:hypothetical protein